MSIDINSIVGSMASDLDELSFTEDYVSTSAVSEEGSESGASADDAVVPDADADTNADADASTHGAHPGRLGGVRTLRPGVEVDLDRVEARKREAWRTPGVYQFVGLLATVTNLVTRGGVLAEPLALHPELSPAEYARRHFAGEVECEMSYSLKCILRQRVPFKYRLPSGELVRLDWSREDLLRHARRLFEINPDPRLFSAEVLNEFPEIDCQGSRRAR